MAKGKRIWDCHILVAECLTMHEVILITIQENTYDQSDSQLIVNISNGKIYAYKDIINLVDDIIISSTTVE